ncbi:hypothetical protein ACLB9X_07135 [Streptomyces sp. 5K101]|uniref:hypothetical protein n=1 Tax=Streptomyces sp. 5K101 TaxID=3390037 RepID=UPI0039747D4A
MSTARLAPGVALVTVPGQGLAVRTPDGEFLRVDTGTADPAALVAHLTGTTGDSPALDGLTDAFEQAGYLARPGGSSPRLAGRTVLVLGDEPLTGALTALVRAEGGETRAVGAAELPAVEGPGTAVVWCLDSPVPPAFWDEADRLPARGVAWLRCHREGSTAWLEPLAAGPGDVTSAHIRLRRLAATPAHRELAAYWAGSSTTDNGPAHSAASTALTAALLTADLVAWAAGADGSRRLLRRVDLRDLAVTAHPVLPVPDVAPIAR